jgi:hypothetical protein
MLVCNNHRAAVESDELRIFVNSIRIEPVEMGVGGRTNLLASRLNSILGAAPTDLASLLGIRSPFERRRRVADRQCLSRWDSNSQSRKVSDRQSNPEPDLEPLGNKTIDRLRMVSFRSRTRRELVDRVFEE